MITEDAIIKGNGYNLSGTLIKPEGNKKVPAVIFYHGMVDQSKPQYIRRAKLLVKGGLASLCFDFRGCGQSDGKLKEMTLGEWIKDAFLAFDYLVNQNFVDRNKIGICGNSFGGYMGAIVSEKRNVRSMVLAAPAVYEDSELNVTHLTEANRIKRRGYRNSNRVLDNKAVRAIEKYRDSLLVIESELDDICPRVVVEGFYKYASSENKKLEWIKGADHSLTTPGSNEKYEKLMVDWFSKTL